MKVSAVDNMKDIEVRLPHRTFRADLSKELAIDTANIAEEFMQQPSKYAWWAVLADLAEMEVDKISNKLLLLSSDSERYQELLQKLEAARESYELLSQAKQAFTYRSKAIVNIAQNPKQTVLIGYKYRSHLSNLRALLDA